MAPKKPSAKEATEEQITTWKNKHIDVVKISIPTRQGEVEFIIGKPTRANLDSISFYINQNNTVKVRDVMFANCVLAGDVSELTDPDDINCLMTSITDLMETKKADIKKL